VEKKEVLISHYGPLSYEEIGYLLNKMTAILDRYAFGITVKKESLCGHGRELRENL
jgi:hypothetical protein